MPALWDVAQRIDPMVKRITEIRKTRFEPKRSESHPASGMTAA
ncbi:MAG: hypothetical protein NVSMB65_03390 [Chloroflexota bacterium]